MSFEITTAFVTQFSDNIQLLCQQKGSRLRNTVDVKTDVKGKKTSQDQVGSSSAKKKTSRHSDTPLIPTPHARRWITMYDYEWADLIDDLDKVKMLADPESPYAQTGANAMGRAMDDEIINTAVATVYVGEAGTTTQTLGSGQQIANGSTGLTLTKLIAAKVILDKSEDLESPRHMAVSAEEIADLLGETEVGSKDYNTVQALVKGEVQTFVGFNFHQTERLSETSSVRTCFGWIETGIRLAIGADIKKDIGPRRDKSLAIQVYYCMSIGATRMEEKKVVEVACYHA
jgi:hypothetical protein